MTDRKKDIDISVLIATYNRANILRQTLENMLNLDMENLNVQFVIIDNNSTDNTKSIVELFADKLSIYYLFEPRPGKNCALNKALNKVYLGELVVFTDDDVKPRKDWLKAIIAVSKRWPDYKVFGGKIYAIWPIEDIPIWAKSQKVQALGFAVHNHGDLDYVYASGEYPFGPNFWVRRDVFANNRRFNENIGPRPKNRNMGSETSFLMKLRKDGYGMVYSPDVTVGHRIDKKNITVLNILKRSYRCGKGKSHLLPLRRQNLFIKHPILWRMICVISIVRLIFLFLISIVLLIIKKPEKPILVTRWIGYNIESLKIAKDRISQLNDK